MGSLTTEVHKISGRIQTLNTAFLFTSTPVPHLLPKLNVTGRHKIVLREEKIGGGDNERQKK